MMLPVLFLVLTAGASALKQKATQHGLGDILKLTMKSRSMSDVTEVLEEQPVDDTAQLALARARKSRSEALEELPVGEQTEMALSRARKARGYDDYGQESGPAADEAGESKTGADADTDDDAPNKDPVEGFLGSNSGCFAVFMVLTGFTLFVVWVTLQMGLKVDVQAEQDEEYERGAFLYNKVAPGVMVFMAFVLFCSIVGGVLRLNSKIEDQNPKTNYPGYEGKSVLREEITNPGERALFASFGLVAQTVFGTLICLGLRKIADVKITTMLIFQMMCRGFIAGIAATIVVEFIRLPFHNFMRSEDLFIARFIVVLLWVSFAAVGEEALKLCALAIGLKRGGSDEAIIPSPSLANFIAETPQALAICGFAAGLGFAFMENLPRYYAMALEQPVVTFSAPDYFNTSEPEEIFIVSEGDLRATRVWVFFVWGLLNINPWLTGIAAIQLANYKSLTEPKVWLQILKVVCILHFAFDFFQRANNAAVEIFGAIAVPVAMYTFRKQWLAIEAGETGLLEDRE